MKAALLLLGALALAMVIGYGFSLVMPFIVACLLSYLVGAALGFGVVLIWNEKEWI